jgi:hypothetical protein
LAGLFLEAIYLLLIRAAVLKKEQTLHAIVQLHDEQSCLGFVFAYSLSAQVKQHQRSLNDAANDRG